MGYRVHCRQATRMTVVNRYHRSGNRHHKEYYHHCAMAFSAVILVVQLVINGLMHQFKDMLSWFVISGEITAFLLSYNSYKDGCIRIDGRTKTGMYMRLLSLLICFICAVCDMYSIFEILHSSH